MIDFYGTFDPADVGLFDLTVVSLAAFRLVHLLSYDKIFDVVRAAFMNESGGRLTNANRGWRRVMCEFLSCIWCTGIWSALIAVTIYFLRPWGFFAALLLAVAGVSSLLQLASQRVAAFIKRSASQ